jgi:predicted metal-dependent HD superfamily phosphohydrolase
MIECTITHTLPSDDTLSSLSATQIELVKRFLDMDMVILASPRAEYLEYAKKIRREYLHYPDEAFRKGRVAFLKGELE